MRHFFFFFTKGTYPIIITNHSHFLQLGFNYLINITGNPRNHPIHFQ